MLPVKQFLGGGGLEPVNSPSTMCAPNGAREHTPPAFDPCRTVSASRPYRSPSRVTMPSLVESVDVELNCGDDLVVIRGSRRCCGLTRD